MSREDCEGSVETFFPAPLVELVWLLLLLPIRDCLAWLRPMFLVLCAFVEGFVEFRSDPACDEDSWLSPKKASARIVAAAL